MNILSSVPPLGSIQPQSTQPRFALRVFLFFWLLYGCTINIDNLRAYTLQQMGPDALVTHHTLTLGHSQLPQLQPGGDTFSYKGHTFAAKQPGQFLWSGIAYQTIKPFGISYEKNYDQAAAWVTWLSASFLAAAGLGMLYKLLSLWMFSTRSSLIAVLTIGASSHWWVYAGIAHHDIMAAVLLLTSVYVFEVARLQHQPHVTLRLFTAGILLGLVPFTSMLPALMVLVALIYMFLNLTWRRELLPFIAGLSVGLLPLSIYNQLYFGSALTQANVAGNYADTFFSPSIQQALHHLNAYLGIGGISVWKFTPALATGSFGWFFLGVSLKKQRFLILGMAATLLSYLINIETMGSCGFGPRYLLPLLPWCAVGVAALLDHLHDCRPGQTWSLIAGALMGYGWLVNMVGSMTRTMNCDLENFAFWQQASSMRELDRANFPLLSVCLSIAVVWTIIEGLIWVRQRTNRRPP
ncbi:MAG: hypothetical protein H6R19_1564 [Proteobacteria bacterium]|nr:hypothetical protein [Pseudomonadota bacterium]